MAQRPNRRETRLRFYFVGWQDGWYSLRLPTRRLAPLVAHAYQNDILEWLIDQDITPNVQSYLANGNTGDGPVVPAADDGHAICLLLRQAADVMRFHLAFGCRHFTPEALYDAVEAEASVHKFVLADLAGIAYDTIRSLVRRYNEEFRDWDDLTDEEQEFFLQVVREYLEDPERTPEQMHEAWLDRRRLEGWQYAPEVDLAGKFHPDMVPFSKLHEREQDKTRLMVAVIRSLAEKLRRRSQ